MFLNQLSVFIENREGRLDQVLETLKNNGINIVSLSLADTSDYGMLRMIVSDAEAAKAALREAGFSAMLTPVMGVKLAHKAGSLQILSNQRTGLRRVINKHRSFSPSAQCFNTQLTGASEQIQHLGTRNIKLNNAEQCLLNPVSCRSCLHSLRSF